MAELADMEYLAYVAPLLTFGVVVAFAIALGALRRRKERQRSERLDELAERVGWRFVGDHEPTYHDQRNLFHYFSVGHSRYAHNQMHGEIDVVTRGGEKLSLPFEAGDFHYGVTSMGGASSRQHKASIYRFSYLLVNTTAGRGSLSVFAKSWSRSKPNAKSRLAGFDSLEFEKRYHVASDDEPFARETLNPRMIDFLLKSEIDQIEVREGWLCLTDGKRRWSPDEFRLHAQLVRDLLGHWPIQQAADRE